MKKIPKSTLSLRKEVVVILNQNQLRKFFGGDPATMEGNTEPTDNTNSGVLAPTYRCDTETQATTRNSKTGQGETEENCYC
jgi:hypothetical protein